MGTLTKIIWREGQVDGYGYVRYFCKDGEVNPIKVEPIGPPKILNDKEGIMGNIIGKNKEEGANAYCIQKNIISILCQDNSTSIAVQYYKI